MARLLWGYGAALVFMTIYIGALVLGGVLLGSSILLGGHDDADLDIDGDVDLDIDGDLDHGELDLEHGELDVDADLDKDFGGDGLNALWVLRSLRFWTFFLAFFGLTGVLLDGFGLVSNALITLGLAITMGGMLGVTSAKVIRTMTRDDTARVGGSGDYIGKSARVLVPIKKGGVGKVRVEIKGQLVDVLAESDDEIGSEDEVLIVEMHGPRARVARIDE